MSHHADEENRFRAYALRGNEAEQRLLEELDDHTRERLRLEERLSELRGRRTALLDPALKARRALFRSWRHLRWDAQKIRALEETLREFFG